MKIKKVKIENFRGISSIELDICNRANILVGPNAVGKTTILEAVRLVKAVLFPRYFQETEQVLSSLGAMSPQPQLRGNYFNYSSLARDIEKPINLSIKISISKSEFDELNKRKNDLSIEFLKGQMGRSDDQGQLALTQFLSSKKGQQHLNEIDSIVSGKLNNIGTTKILDLNLTIEPSQIRGHDQFAQTACALLERIYPPHQALFSYFPADRAFPSGEVNIQIGHGEASSQIQSHIGNPPSKYQRLKQSIVNSILINNVDKRGIKEDFDLVFTELLPGKSLDGLSITQTGTLKVSIKEDSTGKIFDIDSMSSGEKGLILTFLLIRQSIAEGGIVLLDEPELHLNPAVCRKLLGFFIEKIINPNDLQALICTHSGEILGVAFERDDCDVFHVRSHNNATKIYERDHRELFEALRRLGTSTAEALFTNGSIYVEGEHDSSILEDGFYDLLSGYKVTSLGGRKEIEKEIVTLQESEKMKKLDKLRCFIFDLDNKPTNLSDSDFVKVTQWDRYCLENYLLDKKILFDQLRSNSKSPPDNRGDFDREINEIAQAQMIPSIVKTAYQRFEPENPGIRYKEIKGKSYDKIAEILYNRLHVIYEKVKDLDKNDWINNFINMCQSIEQERSEDWKENWIKLCNGKELLDALYPKYGINIPKLEFKKRVIKQMREERSDSWRIVESVLREVLR
ncbi:MAG: AAA family ATPase [Candidatus Competibacteraceae bacterium]|nr:AAA family ATPase [Candidatus Competibacteraceae bacterium]